MSFFGTIVSLFQKPQAPLRTAQAVAVLAAAFIGGWEGYAPVAVHNSFDPRNVITIGHGLTNYDLPGLKAGQKCGKEVDCATLFQKAMGKYDTELLRHVHVAMPPHRHAAMISFVYNVGEGNLARSSVVRYLNAGQTTKACNALLQWTKANGRVLKGLVNRRKAEREWCLRHD